MADLTVWDWAHGPVAAHRDRLARDSHATGQAALHERAFVWMTLGDERNLVETLVRGQTVFQSLLSSGFDPFSGPSISDPEPA